MLPVYTEKNLVGRIEEAEVGLTFTYAAPWLAQEDAFAISLGMPLRQESYPSEIATPWFANLLPEDRQLELVGHLLRRGQGDVYGLLEEIGRDTAGALSIGGPEPFGQADYREMDEAELANAIDRLPARPLLAGEEGVTMSLAGAQSKLAVAVFDGKIALPLNGAASTHILKPASDRFYATVENEFLCMRLAAEIGIEVAPTTMRMAGDKKFLLVERYDRLIPENRRVRRRHQEDFCQALGKYPASKYEARHGPGLVDLFQLVDRHSRVPARDRLALLDLMIYGCCIGDTDRHAKNYSLILSGGGPYLAPGYDLITSLIYDGITRNLAMKIAGQSRAEHVQERHWHRFATELGLAPAATVNRVESLANSVWETATPVARDLSDDFPVDQNAMQLFQENISQRARAVALNCRRDAG